MKTLKYVNETKPDQIIMLLSIFYTAHNIISIVVIRFIETTNKHEGKTKNFHLILFF